MNHAKTDKVSGLRFFEREMNDLLLSKIALTNDMRHGIERGEFELYYQPQVSLTTGKIVGLEAWCAGTTRFKAFCRRVNLSCWPRSPD
ncbi:EAL domain-containing protein [Methylomonas koyamae]|uniref:EAL domain-containing protein n=1 Tax=Methylomonas koyamae TaxID=702114 RepID=UPI0006D072E9|nr:EAL domain-containing protein [Methylomonas koyamae]